VSGSRTDRYEVRMALSYLRRDMYATDNELAYLGQAHPPQSQGPWVRHLGRVKLVLRTNHLGGNDVCC